MSRESECVIVGGGVAGLSAALVLGRARRRTLLLDGDGQSNRPAPHIGGLLGQEGVAPEEFYVRARQQLSRYDTVAIESTEAKEARVAGAGFVVTLADGSELEARTLVLATGMEYEVPDVPGFREHWGDAVFHCPFCHGWEVRDRAVVVCGTGETAEHQAALLRAWTEQVAVVELDDAAGLRVEDGTLRALVRADGSEVECEAVLVHAPLQRRGRLVEQLGLGLTDAGLVEIDGLARTSVPGVYAAGDLAVAPQQVAIAIGSGHLAGIAVVRELVVGRDG